MITIANFSSLPIRQLVSLAPITAMALSTKHEFNYHCKAQQSGPLFREINMGLYTVMLYHNFYIHYSVLYFVNHKMISTYVLTAML